MGHVIRKQVTRGDYGMTPGEQFPYEHQFDEPVYWQYVIVDDPDAPDYVTPGKKSEAKQTSGTAKAGSRA